jgi:hypothetical protein
MAWHLRLGFIRNGIVEHVADEGIHELVHRKLFDTAAPQ